MKTILKQITNRKFAILMLTIGLMLIMATFAVIKPTVPPLKTEERYWVPFIEDDGRSVLISFLNINPEDGFELRFTGSVTQPAKIEIDGYEHVVFGENFTYPGVSICHLHIFDEYGHNFLDTPIELTGECLTPQIKDNLIYVALNSDPKPLISIYEPGTNELTKKDTIKTKEKIYAFMVDDNIYMKTKNLVMSVTNSGTQNWEYTIQDAAQNNTGIFVSDNNVITTAGDSIYILDKSNGKEINAIKTDGLWEKLDVSENIISAASGSKVLIFDLSGNKLGETPLGAITYLKNYKDKTAAACGKNLIIIGTDGQSQSLELGEDIYSLVWDSEDRITCFSTPKNLITVEDNSITETYDLKNYDLLLPCYIYNSENKVDKIRDGWFCYAEQSNGTGKLTVLRDGNNIAVEFENADKADKYARFRYYDNPYNNTMGLPVDRPYFKCDIKIDPTWCRNTFNFWTQSTLDPNQVTKVFTQNNYGFDYGRYDYYDYEKANGIWKEWTDTEDGWGKKMVIAPCKIFKSLMPGYDILKINLIFLYYEKYYVGPGAKTVLRNPRFVKKLQEDDIINADVKNKTGDASSVFDKDKLCVATIYKYLTNGVITQIYETYWHYQKVMKNMAEINAYVGATYKRQTGTGELLETMEKAFTFDENWEKKIKETNYTYNPEGVIKQSVVWPDYAGKPNHHIITYFKNGLPYKISECNADILGEEKMMKPDGTLLKICKYSDTYETTEEGFMMGGKEIYDIVGEEKNMSQLAKYVWNPYVNEYVCWILEKYDKGNLSGTDKIRHLLCAKTGCFSNYYGGVDTVRLIYKYSPNGELLEKILAYKIYKGDGSCGTLIEKYFSPEGELKSEKITTYDPDKCVGILDFAYPELFGAILSEKEVTDEVTDVTLIEDNDMKQTWASDRSFWYPMIGEGITIKKVKGVENGKKQKRLMVMKEEEEEEKEEKYTYVQQPAIFPQGAIVPINIKSARKWGEVKLEFVWQTMDWEGEKFILGEEAPLETVIDNESAGIITKSVKLEIPNENGIVWIRLGVTGSCAEFIDVSIEQPTKPQEEPTTVEISANPAKGQIPLEVQFESKISSPSGIKSISWDFGDGTGSTEQNPAHTFCKKGKYNITLKVLDGTDKETTATTAVEVIDPENLTKDAHVEVSSVYALKYAGTCAIDGISRVHDSYEWASQREMNPWIKLLWDNPITINKLIFYDRPNPTDSVNQCTIHLGNKKIDIGGLPNNGSPKEVVFDPIKVSEIYIELQGAGLNVGLSEIVVQNVKNTQYINNCVNLLSSGAHAIASSVYKNNDNYSAGKAIDGGKGVWDYYEWASNGELSPWLYVWWDNKKIVNKIILWDRPNTIDNIICSELILYSNKEVVQKLEIGCLPKEGTAKEVIFNPVEIDAIKFIVKVGVGTNVGLSEIVAVDDPDIAKNNLAGLCNKITASSYFSENFGPEFVADGIIGIWGTGEWASNGEETPWILLGWNEPIQTNKITFYSRANPHDKILEGKVCFSDGSEIPFGALANGSAEEINFNTKTVTWIKVQVLQGKGYNIGFSEIVVCGPEG